jgi:dynein heavy chain
MKKQETDLTK